MTMVFTVRDKGQLTNLKPGDKVQFMVVQEGGKIDHHGHPARALSKFTTAPSRRTRQP